MTTTATLNGQELEIFRAGDYGKKGKYTAADLDALASSYSDEAAVTIGHPSSDSEPAWGWVKKVRADGGVLFGTFGEVNPHFDALHTAGAYKHRSVVVSRRGDGKLRLRQVAFLGAVPPAVEGLKPAQFSSEPYEEIAFGEGDDMDKTELNKSIGEGIREFFSQFGGGKKSTEIDVDKLTADIQKNVEAKFSADLEAERVERKKVETQLADHKAQFSDRTAESRVDVAISGLKASGAWVPAYDKSGVKELFSALAKSEETIKFSDADNKEQTPNLLDAAVAIFSSVGRIVPSDKKVAATKTETSTAPAQVNGAEVDPSSAAFSEMVQKFADDNKVTFNEAYTTLSRQGKRPAAGSTSAGAV